MAITMNNYNFDSYVDKFKTSDASKRLFTEYLEFYDSEAVMFFCKSTGMFPDELDYAYEVFQNNRIALFREIEARQSRGKLADCFYSSIKDLLVTHTRTLDVCNANTEKLAYWIGVIYLFEKKYYKQLSERQIERLEFQVKVLKNMWNKWRALKTEKKFAKTLFSHKMLNFTFVGVMFHEMMHCLGCILTGTKIYNISLFNNNYDSNDGLKCGCSDGGHSYGLVQRANTEGKAFKSFFISFAPLIFGLPVSLVLFSEVELGIIGLLFLWMGFAICYNSIPSSGDEQSYLTSRIVNKKYIKPSTITSIFMIPFVVIYVLFNKRKISLAIIVFILANTQYLYTLL